MKNRFQIIDTIRGIVLLSMILYHATWNMVYIYGKSWDWYKGKEAYFWQQSICWTFILISGFCFSLGKRHLKSGFMVFGSGLLVTLVTGVFMPQNRVVFGVLTCIGSCILIIDFIQKLGNKIGFKNGRKKENLGSDNIKGKWEKPLVEIKAFLMFVVFLLTKNINMGYVGLGKIRFLELPESWYCNYFSSYLGFTHDGFYSTDYFSLLPWIFLFLTGYYLYHVFQKNGIMEKEIMNKEIKIFAFLGRHSLLIYLLHQPFIFGVQEMLLH